MRKQAIPVNKFGEEDVSIERFEFASIPDSVDLAKPERHDRHSFFLVEEGSITMEIDFRRYQINDPAVIYMHSNQVHRILDYKNIKAIAWALTDDQLSPAYLRQLENITPVSPKSLMPEDYQLFTQMVAAALKLAQNPALASALKDSLQVLVSLVIAQYPASAAPQKRFEVAAQKFKALLEQHFTTLKSPADYANLLNISVPYLNECVKETSGHSASHQIMQRVILEAKRLLVHSNLSVKEIAGQLGYDDYPYFCRLFRKVAGTTPLKFKNHD